MGRWLQLDRAAYIPRPWTEVMVRRGVASLRRARPPRVAVDIGTGSGAIASVISASVDDCVVWALDIDAGAVRWARLNTATATNVRVAVSTLFEALPQALAGQVDLVIGSLPYVPTGEIPGLPRDYRDHEPAVALDGGGDGLEVNQRALQQARPWLRAGGRVMLELGQGQGGPLLGVAGTAGYRHARVHLDEDGDELFLECRP
ncbi:MAG: hypothetical protein NVSMB17_10050 [Candidatus Dormibacteria bacterium]